MKSLVPVSTAASAAPSIPLIGGADVAPARKAPAPVPAAASAPGIDLTGLLLEVVAEKTGYPAEMLDLGMELESDLGIDSIKRVEILSGMREKAPSLPAVSYTHLRAHET